MDCEKDLLSFYSFMRTSILIASLGLLSVFILLLLLSGRIVKPVAESYEKQKRFITDAGHEIKTPLTTAFAYSAAPVSSTAEIFSVLAAVMVSASAMETEK